MEKVSVIIPVYNVEKYINKCIKSIVNQTYKNLEIILIDDESPDNCPCICDEWAKKDERINVIHKKNGGLSDARNIGIERSTGEYVGFVDSDDVISPNMIEDLISLITNDKSDIICCEFARFKENENVEYTRYSKKQIAYKQEALKLLLDEKITNHACNKLFKKKVFEDVRFPVGRKYEDIGVMYKLILNSKQITVCNGKYYGYTIRDESITNTIKQESINDMIYLVNERFKYLDENNVLYEESIISRFECIYIYHLKSILNREVYFSETLNSEYIFLKQNTNIRRLYKLLRYKNVKEKINRIIFTINKRIFYKLKNRKEKNDK